MGGVLTISTVCRLHRDNNLLGNDSPLFQAAHLSCFSLVGARRCSSSSSLLATARAVVLSRMNLRISLIRLDVSDRLARAASVPCRPQPQSVSIGTDNALSGENTPMRPDSHMLLPILAFPSDRAPRSTAVNGYGPGRRETKSVLQGPALPRMPARRPRL